ncbi:MAG: hypothetical protein ACYC6C_05530 [Coriobacteriia bacterium]
MASKQSNRELITNWDEYRISLLSDTILEDSLSSADILKKRLELEANPIEWIKYFFPKYAKAEFALFQKKAIKRIIANPEWYEVLSWSRELSKTTTTMFVVLYLSLTGKKKNIILTSNSYDNAERLLEPYRANLDSNPRIKAFYGNQVEYGHWEMGDFRTKSGVSFRALGAGQSPRGTKNEEIRPDVLIQDDFDTDEDTRNPDIINNRWSWFEQALYPTRSISIPLLVIWNGNIIAKDCCITRAGAIADNWDVINIRDKNGKSSWIEKNSEEHIDRTLSKISTKAAQQEYYNNPISEGDTFKEIHWGTVPPLARFKFLVSYGDPAPSNNKTKANSYKSNFLIGMIDGVFYIITGYLDKATNAEYVDWFYFLNKYVSGKAQTYYFTENNTLQDPFYQQVFIPLFIAAGKANGYYLSISPDERKKPDKYSRIEGNLEPLSRQNRLIFNQDEKNNPHMVRLAEQFLLVNPRLNAPADGPDCIEGGVYICNHKNMQFSLSNISFGKRKLNPKRI